MTDGSVAAAEKILHLAHFALDAVRGHRYKQPPTGSINAQPQSFFDQRRLCADAIASCHGPGPRDDRHDLLATRRGGSDPAGESHVLVLAIESHPAQADLRRPIQFHPHRR